PAFEEIFAEAPGRIIVSTFSSSIHRIQIVIDCARQFGRRICVLGRSMRQNVEIAERLGYLDIPNGLMAGMSDLKHLAVNELVLLVTGSQAEPRAALVQMATGSFRKLSIEE